MFGGFHFGQHVTGMSVDDTVLDMCHGEAPMNQKYQQKKLHPTGYVADMNDDETVLDMCHGLVPMNHKLQTMKLHTTAEIHVLLH
jgi:hypothetical protein